MKMKQLLASLIVLVAVVAVIVVSNQVSKRKPAKEELLFFPGLKAEQIASLTVTEGATSSAISKTGGRWVIPGLANYRADTAKVNAAIKGLLELERGDLMSANVSKQKSFEVDSSSGRRITAKSADGKVLLDFRVGKTGADWRSYFVREQALSKVYVSPNIVKWNYFTTDKEWKDRGVLEFAKTNVTGIKVDHDTVHLALKKDAKGWSFAAPAGAKADSGKVGAFIQYLADLKTDEWADPAVDTLKDAFKKPEASVTLTQGDGSEKTVTLGKKAGYYYLSSVTGDSTIYKLAEYRLNDVRKQRKDFEPDPVKPDSTAQPAVGPQPK